MVLEADDEEKDEEERPAEPPPAEPDEQEAGGEAGEGTEPPPAEPDTLIKMLRPGEFDITELVRRAEDEDSEEN